MRNQFAPARSRGTAFYPSHASIRRSWIILTLMVVLLTALTIFVHHVFVSPVLVYSLGALIIIAAIYSSLQGI